MARSIHAAVSEMGSLGTFPDGTVRVSPGPFNTPEQIDQLALALTEITA